MAGLDLQALDNYPRTVSVTFPDSKKPGKTFDASIRARYNYLEGEEYKDLMGKDKLGKDNFTQEEMCQRFVHSINKEDIKGCETDEQAKIVGIGVIAIQNALILDFVECTSGFARKNSKR